MESPVNSIIKRLIKCASSKNRQRTIDRKIILTVGNASRKWRRRNILWKIRKTVANIFTLLLNAESLSLASQPTYAIGQERWERGWTSASYGLMDNFFSLNLIKNCSDHCILTKMSRDRHGPDCYWCWRKSFNNWLALK